MGSRGYINGQQVETAGQVLTATNVAAGNNYYYFGLGEEGYRLFTFHFALTAMTISFEVSNDGDDVADANKTWVDVTNALFGAPTFTADGMWIQDTFLAVARCRIKYVRSNATNSISGWICFST